MFITFFSRFSFDTSLEIPDISALFLLLQKQPPGVSYKKRCFSKFRKFHRKHLCQTPATLWKKRVWHRCFHVKFAKFSRTSFLQNTSVRLLLSRVLTFKTTINCLLIFPFYVMRLFTEVDTLRKLWIWSYLLKKSLMENFIFCAMYSCDISSYNFFMVASTVTFPLRFSMWLTRSFFFIALIWPKLKSNKFVTLRSANKNIKTHRPRRGDRDLL